MKQPATYMLSTNHFHFWTDAMPLVINSLGGIHTHTHTRLLMSRTKETTHTLHAWFKNTVLKCALRSGLTITAGHRTFPKLCIINFQPVA